MNPFEDLIHELGKIMDITLNPDAHQSCLLNFPGHNISIQIDLDSNADRILIGAQLGNLTPGAYREQILTQAMRVNGMSTMKRGILAYSKKNDTLVLYQFLHLADLNGEKLFNFLQLFLEHASIWKMALEQNEIPTIEGETRNQ